MASPKHYQYGAPRDEDEQKAQNEARQNAIELQDRKPDAQTVQDFHTNADTDKTDTAIHHTLGPSPSQASPGSHRHDGGDSVLLLEGFTVTGSKASPSTVLPSIIACLTRLGAKDSTT